MNCPHPAIFAQHLGTNGRQLARSWYMFFFQIPWLPEALLGLGHARLIADAIRRTAVRQDSLTEETSCTPRGGLPTRRAARRHQLLPRRLPQPEARALCRVAAAVPVRRAADRGPARPARGLAPDQRAHAAGLGEQDVALGKAVGRHGAAHGRAFEVKYIPLSANWVQQEQPQVVNGYLLDFLGDWRRRTRRRRCSPRLAPGARARTR